MRDIKIQGEAVKNTSVHVENVQSEEDTRKSIRIFSESGDIDFIVNKFKHVLDTWPNIKFKSAHVKQKLTCIPADKKNPDYYPLKLYSDKLEIMISEVRCGYHGASPDALIEILKLAGFNLKQKTIDTIYNDHNVNFTIFMEEK